MRKYNSTFKTAFISEAGSELKNNDYFGFVELDDLACYVIADGITQMKDALSAKAAIESIISSFQEEPSLSKSAIRRYLRKANKVLLEGKSYEKRKASVTVVVTNYEKMRYGHAGNTRLRLYRDGVKHCESEDMSYSQQLVDDEKIPKDKMAIHEERNNLLAYLGQEGFHPYISKKIKLFNSDIITLYTRGIWENIDEGELSDVFAQTGNEPMEECDSIEELLLSRQPAHLENYTFCAIYIDKVFADPNRRKRIKKIIIISIIVLVLILIICLIVYLFDRKKKQRLEDMTLYYNNTVEYAEDENFVRAGEECKKALELAEKLRDKEMRERLTNYQMALEAVKAAEDNFAENNYESAMQDFINAENRSRYADNIAKEFIADRIKKLQNYQEVFDNIAIGDKLVEIDSYEMAEQKYLVAKRSAAAIYFDEGKQEAIRALEKLYEIWEEAKAEINQENEDKAAAEVAAAELAASGDTAFNEKDYDAAMVYYLSALEKYTKMDEGEKIKILNKKIIAINEKQEEQNARSKDAELFEEQARLFMDDKNYAEAKIQFQYAMNIYQEIGKDNKVNEIQGMIDIMGDRNEQVKSQEEKEAQQKMTDAMAGANGTVSGNDT